MRVDEVHISVSLEIGEGYLVAWVLHLESVIAVSVLKEVFPGPPESTKSKNIKGMNESLIRGCDNFPVEAELLVRSYDLEVKKSY